MSMRTIAIVWFRRDLRVHDHPALTAAIADADAVVPLFVFDDALLHGRWPAPNRTWFMRESVAALSVALRERGADLRIVQGDPVEVVSRLARDVGATSVYVSRDATPYGRRRDLEVAAALTRDGIVLHPKRGLYVHEPGEVLTADGRPFSVYSPFRRAWDGRPFRDPLPAPDRIPGPDGADSTLDRGPDPIPSLEALGLPQPSADPELLPAPGEQAARDRLARWVDGALERYADHRDRLDLEGTSRLSQDLRFGLLSPVEVLARAAGPGEGRRVFVSELAWREFYAHVLWHHPRVRREPFQASAASASSRYGTSANDAWRLGRTGYPVVDVVMRQLRAMGWMHNRARMITASFLTKDLLLDWRVGETHFMRHLVDGDPASNNGGWQWAASVGTDPQPYFRIFNPVLQGRRFDPDGDYVRRWVPELRDVPVAYIHEPWTMPGAVQAAAGCRIGTDYPAPIVNHAEARVRAIATYRDAKAAGDTSG
jgi:deoxyribodipyrimidine photo-lyase